MGHAIGHRGPDDYGIWTDLESGIGFVHQRLSIVDLSEAGHQPMLSTCQRYVIAFNGEIYNHLELRSILEKSGHGSGWRGHSDTETILACITAWGIEKTLQACTGMFALALWDKDKGILTFARDRTGEKPLYWGWQNGLLLFGSELKALKAHPMFNAKVNRNALVLLLRHNYIPAPYSIYEHIGKLLPGHYISIDVARPKNEFAVPYWNINDVINYGQNNPFIGKDIDAINKLEEKLSDAIKNQMLADVSLGAFLSGGIDSSSIVSLMQKQSAQPIKTFAIGFNEPGFNEAEHAMAVASHLKTDHTELYVTARDALEIIPSLPQIYCEPFSDNSQIPTFLLCKMARQKVTVALTGDAGDELFGGYEQYRFAPKIWLYLERLPIPLRKLMAQLLSQVPVNRRMRKFLNIIDAQNFAEFHYQLMSHWKYPESIILNAREPETLLNNLDSAAFVNGAESLMMARDFQSYMTDDILVKVDRASMANSLETRVPLLDHHVIEFAWTLPLHMKIRNGEGKWLLRQLLYRHIPKELVDRPKKGFAIPIASWLRTSLRDWAEELLCEKKLLADGFFNVNLVRKTWHDHLRGHDNSNKLWSILMFQAWLNDQLN